MPELPRRRNRRRRFRWWRHSPIDDRLGPEGMLAAVQPINGRLWLSEAIANRRFSVPMTPEPPPAELDGRPIDFRALLCVALYTTGSAKAALAIDPYDDVPDEDWNRAAALGEELT